MERETKIKAFDKRIHEIDFARGFLICLVFLDHLCYLIRTYSLMWEGPNQLEPFHSLFLGFDWYWTNPIRAIVRFVALAAFCFISGISTAFSRNNNKRTIEMVGLWGFILIVTNLLEFIRVKANITIGPDVLRIDFNIIGVLAASMVIYSLLQKRSDKSFWIAIIIGFLIHIIVRICFFINSDFGHYVYMPLLWQPSRDVAAQADWMPFVPYVSFFLLGVLVSKHTYMKDKRSYFRKFNFERPICFVGRHTLIIYITHFALLVGLFELLDIFF